MSFTDDRADARLLIGEGAVITLTRAAEVLGFKGADRWLRDEGLVSTITVGGRSVERVVWRKVLARLEQSGTDHPSASRSTSAPRKKYRLADA